jgi:hypothetical protein
MPPPPEAITMKSFCTRALIALVSTIPMGSGRGTTLRQLLARARFTSFTTYPFVF